MRRLLQVNEGNNLIVFKRKPMATRFLQASSVDAVVLSSSFGTCVGENMEISAHRNVCQTMSLVPPRCLRNIPYTSSSCVEEFVKERGRARMRLVFWRSTVTVVMVGE